MTHEDIIQETTLFKVEENYFTANYQGKIYAIGEMLYRCLLFLKEDKSIDYIASKINEDYNITLEPDVLRGNIDGFIDKIKQPEKRNDTLYNYIYFKIKILGEKAISKVSAVTMPLFNKYVLMLLTPIAIFLSIRLIKRIFEDGIIHHTTSLKDTFLGLIMMYLGVVIIGLIHEFGHSSSAAYYKQPSTSIGFGFYLIFPVFYSDVTKVWNLSKGKRIVVNLGGIYFQLLINAIFYFIYINLEVLEFKIILKSFAISNMLLLVYAINPFFRNDGYWIYSDYFGIPNLISEALKFPNKLKEAFKAEPSFKGRKAYIADRFPLFIYSLLYHVIMLALMTALVFLTYKNLTETKAFITGWNSMDWNDISTYTGIASRTFGLFINIYFGFRLVQQFLAKKGI